VRAFGKEWNHVEFGNAGKLRRIAAQLLEPMLTQLQAAKQHAAGYGATSRLSTQICA